MSLRRVRLVALAAAVIVLSSGCGSAVVGRAVPGEITQPQPEPRPIEVPEGFDETPEVRIQPGKPGGTFRVADYEPTTLEPGLALSGSELLIASNVFTTLTRVTPEYEVEPGAAQAWESDKECREWTFKLKSGGTFHNGEPVTAESFSRGWTKAVKGAGAGYLFEAVRGFPEVGSGVKAVDDQTLRVRLSRADCDFPVRVAHPVFSPLPKAKDDPNKPIGNGPFAVESATEGEKVVLARWDDYRIGDKAYLDTVELMPVDDPEVAMNGAGEEFDWARASGTRLRQARDEHAPEGNWIAEEVPGYTGLVPMVKTKPFARPAARKAISYAIDRDKLAEVLLDGSVPPATGLISPSFEDAYQEGTCEPCRYDPGKAKQLAKQGKLGRSTPITLAIPQRQDTVQWAELIKDQVERALGVSVKVEALPPDEYYKGQGRKGASGLFRGAWLPDVATPDDMLRPLLSADGITAGNNTGRYRNKKVEKLLDQAGAA
ncbi:MAG: ABC transporter substrate-binding protein, partial [Thermocrispum sp.]